MKYIVVFITAASLKQAKEIAGILISKRLAACVNILPGINSVFRWQGKIDKAKEVLLLAKTTKPNFKKLASQVKKVHSYECPEIIALPIIAGNKEYLRWIENSVK